MGNTFDMNTISDIKNKIEQAKGKRESIESQIKGIKNNIRTELKNTKAAEHSRVIIQTVAKETQNQLEYRVSELSTLALQAVMEEEWKLKLEFNEKRGRTEATMLLEINEKSRSPKGNFGGGVLDTLGLFSRFGLFSLIRPVPRKFFALDEPLKWLKGADLPEKGAEIIKETSHRLGYQILMVSHSPELKAGADKIIMIN